LFYLKEKSGRNFKRKQTWVNFEAAKPREIQISTNGAPFLPEFPNASRGL